MVSRAELFEECRAILEKSGNDSARFDVMCIFQDMLGDKNPLFRQSEPVSAETEEKIRNLVKKRSEGYPLQYLLGEWEFYGYPFKVGEGVLIPRPDTEVLAEQVLEICEKKHLVSPKIADLCSGSGCIAITLKKELPLAEVYAVELSDTALSYLRRNAELNSANIHIIKGDVLSKETSRLFDEIDIIVCNPPYLTQEDMDNLQKEVTFEPGAALFGGDDGLYFYRRITEIWRDSLRADGCLCYEFGIDQHEDVKKILAGNGFDNITLSRDTQNIIRTAAAQKSEEF